MIVENSRINESSNPPDIILGKDEEVNKRVLIYNILNSKSVGDVYSYLNSKGDRFLINVTFDELTNTFTFTFSDGETLIATIDKSESDLSEYAKIEYVDNKVSELETGLQWKKSVKTYSEISVKYPNPEDGWTVNVDDTDITYRYTGTEWIPISSNSIPLATDKIDGRMSSSDKAKLDSLNNYDDSWIKEKLDKSVEYSEFDEGRKTIQLRNYDSISGVTTSGDGANLAMVSKWDVADYGSTKLPINLNGSKARPTYNDDKDLALLDDVNSLGVLSLGKVGSYNDIPSKLAEKDICTNANNSIITFVVSNSTYGDEGGVCRNIYTQGKVHQTLYWKDTIQERTLTVSGDLVQPSNFKPMDKVILRNKAVAGPKLFSLTTDSSEDDIKAAMTSTISKELITSSDLDKCYSDGFFIKEEVMNGVVSVGWNGTAYTFTEVGLTSPKSDPSLKSIVISVTPEGKYSVVKNGQSSTIITKSNITTILDPYATKEWVEDKGYLTEHQDISGLATKDEIASTYQIKDDLATTSKNGVMSKSDKAKLDDLTKITKVSQIENDSNFVAKSDVPEYSISHVKTGHYVYNLNESKNGEVTKSYKFYSIPNEIKFDMCKFYDELTWLSELGTETVNLDGEETPVSQCTSDKGPYLMISYNDLSKLEFNEDQSSVTSMEIVILAYSMKESLSNYMLKSELSDVLTKTEASSTYVASSDLERLVNEIISKSK